MKASDVVAPGDGPGRLQLPSPIYCSEWIDADHIVVGAGGGGKRFGMANIIILLAIARDCTGIDVVRLTPDQRPPAKSSNGARSVDDNTLWQFVAGLDLDGDVPWCLSPYIEYHYSAEDEGSASWPLVSTADVAGAVSSGDASSVKGFIAFSSITCFYLIAICGGSASPAPATARAALTLEKVIRVALPSDPINPDKKPVALVRNMVAVSHDDKGVHLYSLPQLLRAGRTQRLAAGEDDAAVAPLAEWPLPERVNDLAANRLQLVYAKEKGSSRGVSRGTTPARPDAGGEKKKYAALVLDYVVLCAITHDKLVRLASFRLHRQFADEGSNRLPYPVVEEAVLDAQKCGIQFRLLSSSLRMARLFGLENLSLAAQKAALKKLTLDSLSPDHGAKASGAVLMRMLLVVYDMGSNTSHFVPFHISAAFVPRGSTAPQGGASRASPERGDAAAAAAADPNYCRYGMLQLSVRPAAPSSPLLPDAITCLAPVFVDDSHKDSRLNPFGARIPQKWFACTVEGVVASIEQQQQQQQGSAVALRYAVTHRRPSDNSSLAKKFPSIHKEPISSVAVRYNYGPNSKSGGNVLITTDIGQRVHISTIPDGVFGSLSSGGINKSNSTQTKNGNTKDPLCIFPELQGGGLGLLDMVPRQLLLILLFIVVPLVVLFIAVFLF